jgi:diguanylate cyclase (GGDEF)-like protein
MSAAGPPQGANCADTATQADALVAEARRLAGTGEARSALALASKAVALARGGGDSRREADATEAIAGAQLAMSEYPVALARYLDALAIWRALDDAPGIARCLQGIASVDIFVGDYALALGRLEEALRVAQGGVATAAGADVQHRLGMVYARLGDLTRAREFYEAALDRRRALGETAAAASSLNSLGVLLLRCGEQREELQPELAREDFRRARDLFDEALAKADEVGDPHLKALALGNIGSAVAFLGDLEQALALFHAQLDAVRAMHARHDESLCLANIGEALRRSGRYAEALEVLEDSRRIGEQLQSKARMLRACLELSRCQEALGDHRGALANYQRYHRLDQAVRSEEAESKARNLTVQLAVQKVRGEADSYRAERDLLAAANVKLVVEAHEDALTGLANRRYLDANLEGLLSRSRSERRAFCVALADVDRFKSINDRHSHAVGDEVLRTVGRILRAACRPSDLAARFGGEEFVLALLDTPAEVARAVCERLRAAVADYPWRELRPDLAVTISIGLAEAKAHRDCTELLAAADARLYAAKHAGRNCVR